MIGGTGDIGGMLISHEVGLLCICMLTCIITAAKSQNAIAPIKALLSFDLHMHKDMCMACTPSHALMKTCKVMFLSSWLQYLTAAAATNLAKLTACCTLETECRSLTSLCAMKIRVMMQVEVKGRVNIDKLTSFLEDLRMSKNRTVSLGALMCASDASDADKKHVAEVRWFLHEVTLQNFHFYCSKNGWQPSQVMTSSCPTVICALCASLHPCYTVPAASPVESMHTLPNDMSC